MEILVVCESFSQGQLSLLKGEEVLWFQFKEYDEKGFVLVGSRLHYVSRIIKRKCSIKSSFSSYDDSLISPRKASEDEAREQALSMLSGAKSNLISPATYVNAGARAIEERDRVIAEVVAAAEAAKAQKKTSHLRRKSSEIFNMVVRKDSSENVHSDTDDEKKEKKAKKQKQKKINETVTNWYNSPATKSTNSFFLVRSKSMKGPELSSPLRNKTKKSIGIPGMKKKSKAQERIEKRRLAGSTPDCYSVSSRSKKEDSHSPLAATPPNESKHKRSGSVHFSENEKSSISQ